MFLGPATSKGCAKNPKTAAFFLSLKVCQPTQAMGTMTDEGLLLLRRTHGFQIKFNGYRIDRCSKPSTSSALSNLLSQYCAITRTKVQNLLAYVILKDGVREQFERYRYYQGH